MLGAPSENCLHEADVIFVLDASDLMEYHNFASVKVFVRNLISNVNVTRDVLRIGLVTFADEIIERVCLSCSHGKRLTIGNYLIIS